MKQVVWKKVAKADELISRDAQQFDRQELWLDLAHTGHAASTEDKLSRLCAWVCLAEAQELRYGLRLAGVEIAPGHGEAHKKACLQALALYNISNVPTGPAGA